MPAQNASMENVRLQNLPAAAPAGPGTVLGDLGMATAEYAIATLAACGFAGLLLTLLKSGEVKGLLFGIVRRALSI